MMRPERRTNRPDGGARPLAGTGAEHTGEVRRRHDKSPSKSYRGCCRCCWAACAPATQLVDDNLLRDDGLLGGVPCAAPCFRGITPGVTSWADALTIIEDDAEFDNIQIQSGEEGSKVMQVTWQQGAEAPGCCQMVTEDGETVALVFLRTAPQHNMADLVEVHGEPAWLTGQEFEEDQAVVNLVYPDLPMIVYAFVAGAAEGALSASSPLVGVLYLEQDAMDLFLQTVELHGWEGYGSYGSYMDGEWEVTPSVTLTPTP